MLSKPLGFPGGTCGKEPTCQSKRHERHGSDSWVGKIPWRRAWQPIPVFLPGDSRGQRGLVGYSPRGRKKLNTTETTGPHRQLDACDTDNPSDVHTPNAGPGGLVTLWIPRALQGAVTRQVPCGEVCPEISTGRISAVACPTSRGKPALLCTPISKAEETQGLWDPLRGSR